MRLINEPTEAAIAELSEASSPNQRLMVFDFGGTLDVTVMDTTTDGVKRPFNVISTHGGTFLGWVDFDREIAQMALERSGRSSPVSTSSASTPPGRASTRLHG